jgi:hypothetical protein
MAINPTGPVSSPIITYATAAVRKAVGQETEEDKPRPLPPVEEGQDAEASTYRHRNPRRIEEELPRQNTPERQPEALNRETPGSTDDTAGVETNTRHALSPYAPKASLPFSHPQPIELQIYELLKLAALGQKYKISDGEK